MGWAFGIDTNGREVGYSVKATCDLSGCDSEIDRGLYYKCGGTDAIGNEGMEDEPYCGGFFCDEHLTYCGVKGEAMQLCPPCAERLGDAEDWGDEEESAA
jgi:hypothetical protein